MKTTIKNNILILMGIVFMFVSCNDTSEDLDEVTANPIEEPYETTIGFGLTLQPGTNTEIEHTYEKTGYDVEVKGALVEGDLFLQDVDLNEPIILEVTGAIEVKVKHPDFKKNDLSDVAYYGLDRVDIETAPGAGVVPVPLELVQGYVSVTASENMVGYIEKVKIGKDEVDSNIVYYTADIKKEVKVEVEVFDNEINGEHENVIGEGMVYEVTFFDAIEGPFTTNKLMVKDYYLEKNHLY